MARIAGVNLPHGKHAEIALTYIYGIGRTTSVQLLEVVKIEKTRKIETLTEDELDLIRSEIKRRGDLDEMDDTKMLVEGDLRRYVSGNIKRLQEINTYRGTRHRKRLPCRGQSTKTNARTRRGKGKTLANKKK